VVSSHVYERMLWHGVTMNDPNVILNSRGKFLH
jgi:hypothetical protein